MTETTQVKPFREYDELVSKLIDRGMSVRDPLLAQKKLTQIGYYRLSGYWHNSRQFERIEGKYNYKNSFQKNTSFEKIYEAYLFDKKLRIELSDALGRIEIYLKTIIAHEMGRLDPLLCLNKKQFSKKAFKPDAKINYTGWLERHKKLIKDSKEESILDHTKKDKPIPIWVAVEVWDFGALSKFYTILKDSNKDLICQRLGIDDRNVIENWLINLNGIRNRCAHHSRISNRPNIRALRIPKKGYFNLLSLNETETNKLHGLISVIWFLLKQINPESKWINRIANLIDNHTQIPGFTFKSMGFPEDGFPKDKFPELLPSDPKKEEDSIKKLHEIINTTDDIISSIKNDTITSNEKNELLIFIDKLINSVEKIEELIP